MCVLILALNTHIYSGLKWSTCTTSTQRTVESDIIVNFAKPRQSGNEIKSWVTKEWSVFTNSKNCFCVFSHIFHTLWHGDGGFHPWASSRRGTWSIKWRGWSDRLWQKANNQVSCKHVPLQMSFKIWLGFILPLHPREQCCHLYIFSMRCDVDSITPAVSHSLVGFTSDVNHQLDCRVFVKDIDTAHLSLTAENVQAKTGSACLNKEQMCLVDRFKRR